MHWYILSGTIYLSGAVAAYIANMVLDPNATTADNAKAAALWPYFFWQVYKR